MKFERETGSIKSDFDSSVLKYNHQRHFEIGELGNIYNSNTKFNQNEVTLNDLSKRLSSYRSSIIHDDVRSKNIVNDSQLFRSNKIGNLPENGNIKFSQIRKKLESENVISLSKVNITDNVHQIQDIQYLTKLMKYNYQKEHELNQPIERYNNAIRVDILRESSFKMMKNPKALMMCLNYFEATTGKPISYGLKFVPHRGKCSYVPFVIEYDDNNADGVFYVDQRRAITVKNILAIERVITDTRLTGVKIIANKIGLPSKKFVERINLENQKFELLHYESIVKEIDSNLVEIN